MSDLLTFNGVTLTHSEWLDRLNKYSQWNDNNCLIWHGAITSSGYGRIKIHDEIFRVHRLRMQIHLGRELLPDEFVCHHCDVRSCNSLAHLYIGDVHTNKLDAIKRERDKGIVKGEKNIAAKLNSESIELIKKLISYDHKDKAIADLFNVHPRTIYRIRKTL